MTTIHSMAMILSPLSCHSQSLLPVSSAVLLHNDTGHGDQQSLAVSPFN